MTAESFDVIIVGLGAHGSSALYHLSRNHVKVLGIDRYAAPHNRGSSHGQSRIIRQAYHENPVYVPFVQAAYTLWEELERESGKKLLVNTGILLLGRKDSMVVSGARLSAETHNLAFDWLEAADIRRRFPAFLPAADTVAVWESKAGILFPEHCIAAHLEGAVASGAMIRNGEEVLAINPRRNDVEVITTHGKYWAVKVIVNAGAWIGTLLPELKLPLTIERQVVCWFRDGDRRAVPYLSPSEMPVYIWEYAPGRLFYGFPDLGEGIKIGFHHAGRTIQARELKQDASAGEIGGIAKMVATYLKVDPVFVSSSVCMYTNTPDEDFIIDLHPDCDNILVASPCSGHGFKFSSVIGKILGEMAMGRDTGFDLSAFRIGRFAPRD